MGQNTPAGGGRPLCGRLVPTAPRALAGGAPAAAILNLHHDAAARPGQVRARRVAVGRDRAVALRPTVGRGLYGVPQVWHQLRRAGVEVARCRVERLMRTAGPQGARLGKRFFMTTADKTHNTQLVRNERPLARRRRPRVATLGRVHWFNETRLQHRQRPTVRGRGPTTIIVRAMPSSSRSRKNQPPPSRRRFMLSRAAATPACHSVISYA